MEFYSKANTPPQCKESQGTKSLIQEISEAFNTRFASVVKALAGDLPTPTISYISYLINDNNLPAFDFLEISN